MQGKKRLRAGTPEKTRKSDEMLCEIGEDYAAFCLKYKQEAEKMSVKTVKDLKEGMEKMFSSVLIPYLEKNANVMTEMVTEISRLEDALEASEEKEEQHVSRIEELEKLRETSDVKMSKAEMGKKMEVAQTQVKLLDIDFGKCIDDPKDLTKAAKEAIAAKVRSDEKEKYDQLVKNAVVQVLARQTTKRKNFNGDSDIWTAPVVLTIQERAARWEMENVLRKSKMFPTFHWPKEFLEPMKKIKEELKNGGVDDSTHYVRIRPEQKDGKWRIRADTKPKTGEGKFSLKATWPIMAADTNIRESNKEWSKPTWAQVASGARKAGNPGSTGSSVKGSVEAPAAAANAAAGEGMESH
jgi:hypothetical protein